MKVATQRTRVLLDKPTLASAPTYDSRLVEEDMKTRVDRNFPDTGLSLAHGA